MDEFRFTRQELVHITLTALIELLALGLIQVAASQILLEPWRSLAIILLSAIALLGALIVILRLIGARAPRPAASQIEPGARAFAPSITQALRDPKWERGDQLTFEGLVLLDEIRKGGDRTELASAWLDDVREFLRTQNATAWAMFDTPTGMLPFRSNGYPRAMVELATAVDRALFLIRLTNPRHYGRAHIAQGHG